MSLSEPLSEAGSQELALIRREPIFQLFARGFVDSGAPRGWREIDRNAGPEGP